jgi:membrane-associated phospholipid phosphatase
MRLVLPKSVAWHLALAITLLIVPNGALASDTVEVAGTALQVAVTAAAVGLTLGYKDGTGTLQFGEAAALTLGVTYALKYGIDETRPNGGSHSFPSAHTSISFASAEFMRKRYGWEYGLPAYAVASFVAYSRVESGEHHPQDVVAGAAIGIISSYIFTRPFHGWLIEPDIESRYYALTLSHAW